MKTKITLFLFFICLVSYSQNLTFDEVLNLRKSSLADAEEFLTAKNWKFLQATEPNDSIMGKVSFAYNKNLYEDKAESFINLLYDSTTQRLGMQISKPETYNKYIARIKALGCKIIDSKIENGEIVKVYQGATTTIKVSVGSQKEDYSGTKTYYYFFICENIDYELNFGAN